MTGRPQLRFGFASHAGLERERNEDAFVVYAPYQGDALPGSFDAVFVVADGMGGHQSGDVASRFVADTAASRLTLALPGAYETAGAVMNTIGSNVLYGRPDDYVFIRKAQIEAITPAEVDAAAKTISPAAITWVVVGDLSKIEAPIRALQLGEVTILDADGKPVVK